jgi:hypothetical protein
MILPSNLDDMIPASCNTGDAEILANMRLASDLPLSWLLMSEDTCLGTAMIVGGGPSVRAFLPTIKARQQAGEGVVVAMNGSLGMLTQAGIKPDFFVLLDARKENLDFLTRGKADHYLIASQCHPDCFIALAGSDVTLWHPNYRGVEDIIGDRECALIGGGTTVGLQSMSIMFAKGHRSIDLYGFDSSYTDNVSHAYSQPMNVNERVNDYMLNGKTFTAPSWMARQAMEFQTAAVQLADADCVVSVHGFGLLPEIAKSMVMGAMTEKQKYSRVWDHATYRDWSPGEDTASLFVGLCAGHNIKRAIDFGCGTGRGGAKISKLTGWDVRLVDFADNCLDDGITLPLIIADLSEPMSTQGDVGYCTDVLEHIEPPLVDDVITNIMACVKMAFFQISLVPDSLGALVGAPLHLSVFPADWWSQKFSRYGILHFSHTDTEARFFVVNH